MGISQNRIKELFEYQNGNLIRKVNVCNVKAGDIAGRIKNRYIRTSVDGKEYRNHRLIWLYHYGYIPENDIDHIDQNKVNNKIENLREVSRSCNMRNTGNPKDNTSGVKGVSWHKRDKRWRAHVRINKKDYHLGNFKSFDEAVCYRLASEQCLNWNNCNSNSPAYEYVNKLQAVG